MNKGLEALKRLSAVASMYCDDCATSEEDLDRGMFEKDYQAVKTIEKELKAFQIAINHRLDLEEVYHKDYEWFMLDHKEDDIGFIPSKKEYNLVKEIVDNE